MMRDATRGILPLLLLILPVLALPVPGRTQAPEGGAAPPAASGAAPERPSATQPTAAPRRKPPPRRAPRRQATPPAQQEAPPPPPAPPPAASRPYDIAPMPNRNMEAPRPRDQGADNRPSFGPDLFEPQRVPGSNPSIDEDDLSRRRDQFRDIVPGARLRVPFSY
ncbi:hypothetical protein RQ831_12880 [Roseomonas gilardii]|uniref:Uncharacterized protein n=1 Tax=Roseomonas gilardii TaxID=257708 RepID=A0ABU3MGU8_9PROT|nr:hypothetical protein [Roseomonas gilardii]MDT8331950.1 hypothetical protein [Roseomonas gilardii]